VLINENGRSGQEGITDLCPIKELVRVASSVSDGPFNPVIRIKEDEVGPVELPTAIGEPDFPMLVVVNKGFREVNGMGK
jgi:hypothetical protein